MVERGTAAASRQTDLSIAGKTGTAQNPHGQDHGWFIGFAPADNPEIIVGGIMEFAKHGTFVAPYVVRAIRRYLLGPEGDAQRHPDSEWWRPEDSVTSSSSVIEVPAQNSDTTVSDSVP